jgi:hypothetical protein
MGRLSCTYELSGLDNLADSKLNLKKGVKGDGFHATHLQCA